MRAQSMAASRPVNVTPPTVMPPPFISWRSESKRPLTATSYAANRASRWLWSGPEDGPFAAASMRLVTAEVNTRTVASISARSALRPRTS